MKYCYNERTGFFSCLLTWLLARALGCVFPLLLSFCRRVLKSEHTESSKSVSQSRASILLKRAFPQTPRTSRSYNPEIIVRLGSLAQ